MLKKDRRKNGGKIAVKHLNQLLNESYKNKKNTSERIDNYELDKDHHLIDGGIIKEELGKIKIQNK